MADRKTARTEQKAGRRIRGLCAAALLLICISAMSAGVYARYAAVYRATHDIRLRVESGTYAVVLHYGAGYTHIQSEQSETGTDHDIYSFICRRGEQIVIPAVGVHYTRTGYTGSGWNTAADGSGTGYPDGYTGTDLIEGGETLNLYAQWSANSYQVHYAANLPGTAIGEPDNMPEDAIWKYDGSHTLASAPAVAGYIFDGWFLDSPCTQRLGDADSDLGKPNLSDTEGGIVTIYAGWSPGSAQYRVNHLIQRLESAGRSTLSEQDYELADSMVYTGTTDSEVTPDTISHSGYASPPVSSGRVVNDGSGVWSYYYTLIPYTLVLDANTGQSSDDEEEIYSTETVYYGQEHSLTDRVPTRRDYVFTGWYTQPEGGERTDSVGITRSLRLYAHWRPDIVTVTYHQNLLPQGYTPVSWIAGDGESYIRTGVIPDGDTQIRVIYEAEDANQSAGIFGTASGDGYYAALEDGALRMAYGAAADTDESTAQSGIRSYDSSPLLAEDTGMASGRHVIYANRHVWRTDTQEAAVFAYAPFETSDAALIFGASGVSGYFKGRIYGAQFMSKNQLVASLIPAVNGAGEPGMYDITSGYFLRNAGTGEFAVGTEVVSESQETIRGRSIQTIGNTYESNGYCLTQWNTRSDGSGTGYAPGSYIEPQEDMELYAIWEHMIPTLKAEHAWFDSTVGGTQSSYTEIHIVDEISDDIAAEAEAVWNADDADAGTIRCYKIADKLWIAGNGSGAIRVPQDARGLFNGMGVSTAGSEGSGNTSGTESSENSETSESNENARDRAFYNVIKLDGLDILDTSQCGSLAWMFSYLDESRSYISVQSMTYLKDLHGIEAWDISGVSTLSGMFAGMRYLAAMPDISRWDTSGVTGMDYIFTGVSSLTELDLNSWDTSSVTTLKAAFYSCSKLARLHVDSWNTSQVQDCSYTFSYMATSSGGRHTLDLSGWTLPRATSLTSMFQQCIWLRTIYVSDIWEVDLTAEDANMFTNCFQLRGEAGTCQYSPHTGCDYAHIDTVDNPGYLTRTTAVAATSLLPVDTASAQILDGEAAVEAGAEAVSTSAVQGSDVSVSAVSTADEPLSDTREQSASGGTETAALSGSEDLQQKYIEVLFRYEGSLYDASSGEFSPGISPVTGIEYVSKEAWMSSEEYLYWDEECEYLKSLLYPAISSP